MEFDLRIQEFIELVRSDKKMDAVKYEFYQIVRYLRTYVRICHVPLVIFCFLRCRHARKYFSCYEDSQLEEIQHCMALLAFPADTRE